MDFGDPPTLHLRRGRGAPGDEDLALAAMFALWRDAAELPVGRRYFTPAQIAARCGLRDDACLIALRRLRRMALVAADGARLSPTIAGFGRIAEIVDLDAAAGDDG